MTEDSTPPILGHALDQPSAFTPKNLIDDVRRSRQIPAGIVPPVCILEFDGDPSRTYFGRTPYYLRNIQTGKTEEKLFATGEFSKIRRIWRTGARRLAK
jgi:hypothetical protein